MKFEFPKNGTALTVVETSFEDIIRNAYQMALGKLASNYTIWSEVNIEKNNYEINITVSPVDGKEGIGGKIIGVAKKGISKSTQLFSMVKDLTDDIEIEIANAKKAQRRDEVRKAIDVKHQINDILYDNKGRNIIEMEEYFNLVLREHIISTIREENNGEQHPIINLKIIIKYKDTRSVK